jgi:polyhydroxyalkanoate synthesis regulator phasin
MKNFIMSGGSGKIRKRSIFMRLLMGLGAAATTYIVMPRMRKMVNTMVKKGMERSEVLVQKGKESMETMRDKDQTAEKKSPDGGNSYEPSPEYFPEQDEILKQISELQLTITHLQAEVEDLRAHT